MTTFGRLFAVSLFLFSSVAFSAVDSKKIASLAKELGTLFVSDTHKVKPASPIAMMKELSVQLTEDDHFRYNVEESQYGDSMAWGIQTMSKAISWVESAELLTRDEEGEEIKNSPKAKKAGNLIRSLVGTGVVFGAGPFGAVQCGFTFPALLLIDTASGTIYSFETEDSGC